MANLRTMQQIDRALAYVASRSEIITQAHDELGLPLIECIQSAVRQALTIQAAELNGPVAFFQEHNEPKNG